MMQEEMGETEALEQQVRTLESMQHYCSVVATSTMSGESQEAKQQTVAMAELILKDINKRGEGQSKQIMTAASFIVMEAVARGLKTDLEEHIESLDEDK